MSPLIIPTPAPASGGASAVGCSVYKSGTQAITKDAFTAVTFDSEDFDTSSMHDTSSNTSRITIPSTGFYLFGGSVHWTSGGDGSTAFPLLYVRSGGSTPRTSADGQFQIVGPLVQSVSGGAYLTANDYIELVVMTGRTGGDTLKARSSTQASVFYAYKVY